MAQKKMDVSTTSASSGFSLRIEAVFSLSLSKANYPLIF
jgi:hypothetical protein